MVRDCDTALCAASAKEKAIACLSTVARCRCNSKVRSDGNARAQRKTLGIPAECLTPPLGLPVQLRVAILGFMGGASTVLTSVQDGDLWRVQIAWPNGTLHHFGKFRSELDAQG